MPDYSNLLQRVLNSSQQTKEASIGENVETLGKLDSQYQPTSRTTDPNEFAALNQTGLDKTGNILARGTNTFVGGVLGTVGLLYDLPASTFKALTGDGNEGWDYFMNEGINANIAKLQEDINKEVPLYQTYKDSKTPFTVQNIADGFIQGAAFIGSAWAGGELTAALSGINKADKALRTARASALISNESKVSKLLTNPIFNNVLDKSRTIGGAIYNRAFESTLEAKGTGQELRDRLTAENEEYYNQTGTFRYTDEDINNRVRQAEKLNFGFNLALGLIDAYQNAKIFKGFSTDIGKAANSKIDDAIEEILTNKNLPLYSPKKIAAFTGKYGKKAGALTTTGLAESVEELAQYSSNKLSQDLATNNYTKDDWENFPNLLKGIVGKMGEDILTDPEAQFSAFIGGLVGAPMGLLANRAEDKQKALLDARKKVAQQSLIEKNTLAGLYKIRNGNTTQEKVEGEIQVRFANDKSFQQEVFNQLEGDNFEDYLNNLENSKNTTEEELKALGIQPKYNPITGQIVKPTEMVNEAIESAKSLKRIYDNVALNFAKESPEIKRNIAGLIADSNYTDKKIDIINKDIVNTINKYLTNPNVVKKLAESNPELFTKDILENTNEYINAIDNSLKDTNLSFGNITVSDKEKIDKSLEEVKQLKALKKEFLDTYEKYKDPNYVSKVEEQIVKNTEALESNPKEEIVENIAQNTSEVTVDSPIVPSNPIEAIISPVEQSSPQSDTIAPIEDNEFNIAPQNRFLGKPNNEPTVNTDIEDIKTQDAKLPQIESINSNSIEGNNLNTPVIQDIPITETKGASRLSTFTEETTGNGQFNYTQYKSIKDSKGKEYTQPNFEELQKVQQGDTLTIKGLKGTTDTNTNYGLVGIFKGDTWLSTMRITQGNDKVATEEAKKIYKEVFGTEDVILGNNNPKKEFTFKSPYISLREINITNNIFDLTQIALDSPLYEKIVKQDNIPSILRVKSNKGVIQPVVVLGNKELPTSDIYFGNLVSGDTYLISEKANTPEGYKYVAIPLGVKSMADTTVGKGLVNAINELKDSIVQIKANSTDAVTKRNQAFNRWLETRSYISSLIKIVNSDSNTDPKTGRIVDLKIGNNNNKEVQISIYTQYKEGKKTITKEAIVDLLSKDVESQLDKFNSILLDLKPSLSIEGFNDLSFLPQQQVYDEVKEFLQTKADPNNPFKGTNITVPFLDNMESSKVTKDPELIIQNNVETIKPVESKEVSSSINKYSKKVFSNQIFDEVKINQMLEGKSPKIVQEINEFKRDFLTKLKADKTKYQNMLPQMQSFMEEYIKSDGNTELKKPC